MKHISTRYHRTRDEIKSNTIVLKYVPTAENLADVFTKQLDGPAHYRMFNLIMHHST